MSVNIRGGTLFQKVIHVEVPKQRKGRSLEFITKRNECLFDRYLFYALATKKRYEAITEALSLTFFLSQVTIVELIGHNTDQILLLKKQYSGISAEKLQKDLQKKWPEYNWKT